MTSYSMNLNDVAEVEELSQLVMSCDGAIKKPHLLWIQSTKEILIIS